MTSTDSISSTSTTSIITNTSITSTQESQQTSSSWNGREAVQIETDSDAQSSQVSAANKVESTATTSFTEQTEVSDSPFNPFQNVQTGLMSGFGSLQNAFSVISKSFQEGISTLTNNLPFVSENTSQPDFNEELTRIQSLPDSLQGLIGSYIDPTGTILEMVKNEDIIPDYLIHHARHVTQLDIASERITNQQLLKFLKCFENLELLCLPTVVKDTSINLSKETEVKNDLINTISNLKRLQHLDMKTWIYSIQQRSFLTDDMIKRIIDGKNLHHLNIDCCTGITVKGFSYIATCQTLTCLSSNYCKMEDESLSEIAKISSLQQLNINFNPKLTISGFKDLTKLTNLTVLNASRIQGFTDEVAEVISNCQSLEQLDISHCDKITNKALDSFSKLSSLKLLSFKNCNNINDEGINHLSSLTELRELNLSLTSITEKGLSVVEYLTNLEFLSIFSCPNIKNNSLKILHKCEKLKQLVVKKENCTDEDMAYLKEKLPELKIHRHSWSNNQHNVEKSSMFSLTRS